MHLDRMIVCVMALFTIATSYGMSEFKVQQYSPDRSSSPLISVDWSLGQSEHDWKAKRVLKEADEFMQSVHMQTRDSNVYCDLSGSIEERTSSDSESSTLSELSSGEDGYSIMYDIGDCTLRDANGTLSFMQEAERSAQSAFEVTERTKANIDHIDRASANILRNIMNCGKCFGGWLIYTTAGVTGPCLATAGIIRMMRENNIDTMGTDENHIDIEAGIAIASGTVMTACAAYGWGKHIMTTDGPRPVATHDV